MGSPNTYNIIRRRCGGWGWGGNQHEVCHFTGVGWCAWEGLLAAPPPPQRPPGLCPGMVDRSAPPLEFFWEEGRCGGTCWKATAHPCRNRMAEEACKEPRQCLQVAEASPVQSQKRAGEVSKGRGTGEEQGNGGEGKALGLPHPPRGCFSCLLLGWLFICWWWQRCRYRPSLETTAGYSPSQRLWWKGWLLGGQSLCSGRSLAGGSTPPAVPLHCCPPQCCLGCLRAPACWGLAP